MTEVDFYFKLRYEYKITDYKKVSEYSKVCIGEDLSEDACRSKYSKNGGINQFICDAMNKEFACNDFDSNKLKAIQNRLNEFHEKYTLYFNENRKELFSNYSSCMEWFKKQKDKCGYCEITQDELTKIVESRGGKFTLNNKSKRSGGILEIEKKDSNKDYEQKNIILACPLCNNAKSNLIGEDDWKEFFVEPMKKYYVKLLSECKD